MTRWRVMTNPDPTSPLAWTVRGPNRVFLRRTFGEAYALRASLQAAEEAVVRFARLQSTLAQGSRK